MPGGKVCFRETGRRSRSPVFVQLEMDRDRAPGIHPTPSPSISLRPGQIVEAGAHRSLVPGTIAHFLIRVNWRKKMSAMSSWRVCGVCAHCRDKNAGSDDHGYDTSEVHCHSPFLVLERDGNPRLRDDGGLHARVFVEY